MNDNELLWKMYEDNRVQAQLHEDRRAAATALIGGGFGALVAAIVNDGVNGADIPFALMIVVMGLFGWGIALKATERMRLHNARCKVFLHELDQLDRTRDIVAMKNACDKAHARKHWLTYRLPLSSLWQMLHLLVVIAGVLLTLYIDPAFFSRAFNGVYEQATSLLRR